MHEDIPGVVELLAHLLEALLDVFLLQVPVGVPSFLRDLLVQRLGIVLQPHHLRDPLEHAAHVLQTPMPGPALVEVVVRHVQVLREVQGFPLPQPQVRRGIERRMALLFEQILELLQIRSASCARAQALLELPRSRLLIVPAIRLVQELLDLQFLLLLLFLLLLPFLLHLAIQTRRLAELILNVLAASAFGHRGDDALEGAAVHGAQEVPYNCVI
mmetsp:Transcript_35982/g.108747  ORF Transcript_35982/g.108747 Transcript_35982/m.108747 type:complete len:215 (+) Transcript_35982:987-1631(+)